MELAITLLVIVAIILAWLYIRQLKKNRRSPAQPILLTATWGEESDEYEEDDYSVIRINRSRTSDREYKLLRNESSGGIACTCPGYRYSPKDGCIHTTEYIEEAEVDEEGYPPQIEGRRLRFNDQEASDRKEETAEAFQLSQGAEVDADEWKDMNYVVLDTETTGLSGRSKVVEIAIIDRDGQVLINTLVNPGRSPIQPAAREIHGITRDDVKGKPTFDDLWPDIKKIFNDHDIALAYNADFDFRLMAQSLTERSCQEEIKATRRGCIMKGYFRWQVTHGQRKINEPYLQLEAAAKECEAKVEGTPHRALYDSETARQLVTHMLTKTN